MITCAVPPGINSKATFVVINDLPDSLKLTTSCMYADDTQGMSIRLVTIYATRLRSNAA